MTILQRYSLSNILCLLIFSFYCGSVIAKDKVPDLIPGTMKITAEQLIDLVETKEATRAGERGRGFAVVADEVRSLASRTQDFTLEIQTVINELQTQAREAVDSMTRGTSRVESSVLHINSTGEALHGITAAINKITQMSEQIASASEEQNAVSIEASRCTKQP